MLPPYLREVLCCIAHGYDEDEEIASRLNHSLGTAATYAQRVITRLKVKKRWHGALKVCVPCLAAERARRS